MTGEERVSDLFGRLAAQGVELDDQDLAVIAEALTAVRLEERKAVADDVRRKMDRLVSMGERTLANAMDLLAYEIEHPEARS